MAAAAANEATEVARKEELCAERIAANAIAIAIAIAFAFAVAELERAHARAQPTLRAHKRAARLQKCAATRIQRRQQLCGRRTSQKRKANRLGAKRTQ